MTRKAPKRRAIEVPKKQSNPGPQCDEDCNLFSCENIDDALARLDNETDQDSDADQDDEPDELPTIPQHSTEVFHCCNLAAHQDGHHYVCRVCASLASTYLRQTPNALLDGGPRSTPQGQRFFPLCHNCSRAAKASGNQGCTCDCLDQALCFQCKHDRLETAAARRDAEVNRRLGFAPFGEKVRGPEFKCRFLKPILKCICGSEKVEIGNGERGILRCAGCTGTVLKDDGRVWDPLAKAFVVIGWTESYCLVSSMSEVQYNTKIGTHV